MTDKLPLSGVIITKNEADRIECCVKSLVSICAEVVVLDSGSSDRTVELARHAGARVEHQDWLGFAAQKNAVIERATHSWVLLLDSDEWLDEQAPATLRKLFANNDIEQADMWILQRRTHFLGKVLNFGGWGAESVERLFRNDLRYLDLKVHERLDLRGKRVNRLKARIEHDTARSFEEYAGKLRRYAQLFAEQKYAAGKRATIFSPLLHAGFYLIKNFLFRGGFLDGKRGAQMAFLHTHYVYSKYQYLRRMG
jgi:(heptosyl)LPS beta-1,4-glucosyltransferase